MTSKGPIQPVFQSSIFPSFSKSEEHFCKNVAVVLNALRYSDAFIFLNKQTSGAAGGEGGIRVLFAFLRMMTFLSPLPTA